MHKYLLIGYVMAFFENKGRIKAIPMGGDPASNLSDFGKKQ